MASIQAQKTNRGNTYRVLWRADGRQRSLTFASELGCHITLVKDAIAGMSWKAMNATLELSLPNYANDIVTADEAAAAIAAAGPPAR